MGEIFSGVRFYLGGFDRNQEHKLTDTLENHGAVSELVYAKCTHVIVHHSLLYDAPVCVSAIKEKKALVLKDWVEDSLQSKHMKDATNPLYTPVRDPSGIPGCKDLCVCLTNYHGQPRQEIMRMVKIMGARFSKTMTPQETTHLICYKFEGDKYKAAKETNRIKLVNHRWVEDCLRTWSRVDEDDYNISGFDLEELEAQQRSSQFIQGMLDDEDVVKEVITPSPKKKSTHPPKQIPAKDRPEKSPRVEKTPDVKVEVEAEHEVQADSFRATKSEKQRNKRSNAATTTPASSKKTKTDEVKRAVDTPVIVLDDDDAEMPKQQQAEVDSPRFVAELSVPKIDCTKTGPELENTSPKSGPELQNTKSGREIRNTVMVRTPKSGPELDKVDTRKSSPEHDMVHTPKSGPELDSVKAVLNFSGTSTKTKDRSTLDETFKAHPPREPERESAKIVFEMEHEDDAEEEEAAGMMEDHAAAAAMKEDRAAEKGKASAGKQDVEIVDPSKLRRKRRPLFVYRQKERSEASSKSYMFAFSGHSVEKAKMLSIVRNLGGKCCRSTSNSWMEETTHHVMTEPLRRTEKSFAAAAAGRWILRPEYLDASQKAGRFVEEEPYEWYGSGLNGEKQNMDLAAPRYWRKSREKSGCGAFQGIRIVIYGKFCVPPVETLRRAIAAGGGLVLAWSAPYKRLLENLDYAICGLGLDEQDGQVREFLKHGVACVSGDYFVNFVCLPGTPLDRYILFGTDEAEKASRRRLESIKNNSRAQLALPPPAEVEDEDFPCSVCKRRDKDELMLLCGDGKGRGCDTARHTFCCDPPLERVPDGDWYCEKCTSMNVFNRR